MLFIEGREIKGVAFDLEGTSVDLERHHFAAHVHTARLVGLELDLEDPTTYLQIPNFIGGPGRAIMEQIQAWAGQRTGAECLLSIEEMLHEDRQHYLQLFSQAETTPREGLLGVLQELEELGIPSAIGSLTVGEDAQVILQKSGLYRLFPADRILRAEDVKRLKLNPEVYLKTAESMGINPYHQLVFEDSHNGVKAAIGAGSIAIGMPVVLQSGVAERLIQAGAFRVVNSWREVNLGQYR